MTTYFAARKAEKCFAKYKALVTEYWNAQPQDDRTWMSRDSPAPENEASLLLREKIISLYLDANTSARVLGVPVTAQSYPAPAVGGPVIPVNILYSAIDRDQGHARLPKQRILDTINLCLATATLVRKKRLWTQILNPVWWVTEIIAYVLRIPFVILKRAGVPASAEESVWGHIVKIAFFAVLVLASLHWGLKLSAKSVLDFLK